jgi:NADH:ubiquinone oxidoreductase subunit D
MGPQHPSTHGVFRMVLTLSGETILKADLVMGYLHRGVEKQCEEGTYVHNITATDRLDYLAAMTNNLAFSIAAENLAGVEVPRARLVHPHDRLRAPAHRQPLRRGRHLRRRRGDVLHSAALRLP